MKRNYKRCLHVYWGREAGGCPKDLIFYHPTQKSDGHLLHGWMCEHKNSSGKTLIEELEERGFDISTLKFSIQLKE